MTRKQIYNQIASFTGDWKSARRKAEIFAQHISIAHVCRINSLRFGICKNSDGTELNLTLPDNPITQDILDVWDRQTIDNDIAYHQRELEKLMKVKADLEQK